MEALADKEDVINRILETRDLTNGRMTRSRRQLGDGHERSREGKERERRKQEEQTVAQNITQELV